MELAGEFQDRADMAIKEIQLSLEKAKTGFREKKAGVAAATYCLGWAPLELVWNVVFRVGSFRINII